MASMHVNSPASVITITPYTVPASALTAAAPPPIPPHRPRPSASLLPYMDEADEHEPAVGSTHQTPVPIHLDPSSYALLSQVGQGGFASVYRARYIPTGEEVAIKIFDLEADWQRHMDREQLEELIGVQARKKNEGVAKRNAKYKLENVWREVTMTQQLRHPNICKYTYAFCTPHSDVVSDETRPHSSSSSSANNSAASSFLTPPAAAVHRPRPSLASVPVLTGNQFYIIMPLCEGSVKQMMSALYPTGVKDDKLIASILAPIVSVLAYMHNASNHKVHLDLKLDNILLDRYGRVLLSDFGICEDFWTDTSDLDWLSNSDDLDEDDTDYHSREGSRSRSTPSTPSTHHKPTESIGRQGSIRRMPRRKFQGTPLMMAPEVLAQASLSSMNEVPLPLHSPPSALTASAASPVPRGSMNSAASLSSSPALSSSPVAPSSAASRDFSLQHFDLSNPNPSFHAASSFVAKADCWSLGILALSLAFGAPPHSTQQLDAFHLRRLILDSPPPTVQSMMQEFCPSNSKEAQKVQLSDKFQQFVADCLVKDPLKRASAADLLKHKFLSKYACTKTSTSPSSSSLSAAAAASSPSRRSVSSPTSPTHGVPFSPTSTSSSTSAPLYHTYICSKLVDPFHERVTQARIREDRERKEAEKLSKRSMSKAEISAMKAMSQVAQQLQSNELVES